MDSLRFPEDVATSCYLVNGMQPVFVQLPDGRWINTGGITCVEKVGIGLHIIVGGEGVSIPDAIAFWGTQTTTPGR
jgi:hypothetical protein